MTQIQGRLIIRLLLLIAEMYLRVNAKSLPINVDNKYKQIEKESYGQ